MPRLRKHTPENAHEWFWSKTVREGECLIWNGHKTWGGYGLVSYEGRMQVASRVAYRLALGAIPEGHEICHMCPGGDRQDCVNPDHLYTDTHSGNMKDSHAKRRARGLEWHARYSERLSPARPIKAKEDAATYYVNETAA